MKNQLVVGFPIDEGVLGFQMKYAAAAVSPAYGVWKIKNEHVGDVNVRYLELVLRSQKATAIYKTKMQGAVNRRRNVPAHIFKDIEIPFPQPSVQNEIVAIADKVEALKQEIDVGMQAIQDRLSAIW